MSAPPARLHSKRYYQRQWRARTSRRYALPGGGHRRRVLFAGLAVTVFGVAGARAKPGVTHAVIHAAAPHAAPAAPAPAPAPAAAAPDGAAYTPQAWAAALLTFGGWPQTTCNLNAVVGWQTAEGSNRAWFNPLDTTQPEPGSTSVNSVNVQAYPSWQAGFQGTVTTLHNGDYPAILAALVAGNNAQAVADAVAGSPWGTGPFTVTC